MVAFFVMFAAAVGAPFGSVDLNNVPVEYQTAAPADLRVPISDSVRAATWDSLSTKPTAPVRVRLACIVWNVSGAPGACVPADLLPKDKRRQIGLNFDDIRRTGLPLNCETSQLGEFAHLG